MSEDWFLNFWSSYNRLNEYALLQTWRSVYSSQGVPPLQTVVVMTFGALEGGLKHLRKITPMMSKPCSWLLNKCSCNLMLYLYDGSNVRSQETQLSHLCSKTCWDIVLVVYQQTQLKTHTRAIKPLFTIRDLLFWYDIKINSLLTKFYSTIWSFDTWLTTIQLTLLWSAWMWALSLCVPCCPHQQRKQAKNSDKKQTQYAGCIRYVKTDFTLMTRANDHKSFFIDW